MVRNDLDLAKRVHAMLVHHPHDRLNATDIALKFDVDRLRVGGLLRPYVVRGYLDRTPAGRTYEISLGPVWPEDVEQREAPTHAVDFDALEAVGFDEDEIPAQPMRHSKYSPIFDKLRKPGLCVKGLPRVIYEGLRYSIMKRHKNGSARYRMRLADGGVNLYRLPDATTTVHHIKRAA